MTTNEPCGPSRSNNLKTAPLLLLLDLMARSKKLQNLFGFTRPPVISQLMSIVPFMVEKLIENWSKTD